MKKITAQMVRDAIQAMPSDNVMASDVCDCLDLIRDAEKQPVYNAMRDMARRGEIVKVESGVYRKIKLLTPSLRAPVQQRMWAILRMRRTVTAYELASLSGASVEYAQEYLGTLATKEIVRCIEMPGAGQSKYQLLVDTVDMPQQEAKAERLRKLRLAKKQAMIAINAIGATVDALRQTVESIEED